MTNREYDIESIEQSLRIIKEHIDPNEYNLLIECLNNLDDDTLLTEGAGSFLWNMILKGGSKVRNLASLTTAKNVLTMNVALRRRRRLMQKLNQTKALTNKVGKTIGNAVTIGGGAVAGHEIADYVFDSTATDSDNILVEAGLILSEGGLDEGWGSVGTWLAKKFARGSDSVIKLASTTRKIAKAEEMARQAAIRRRYPEISEPGSFQKMKDYLTARTMPDSQHKRELIALARKAIPKEVLDDAYRLQIMSFPNFRRELLKPFTSTYLGVIPKKVVAGATTGAALELSDITDKASAVYQEIKREKERIEDGAKTPENIANQVKPTVDANGNVIYLLPGQKFESISKLDNNMRDYIDMVNGDSLNEGVLSWVANKLAASPKKFSADDFAGLLKDTNVTVIVKTRDRLADTIKKAGHDPALSNEVKTLDNIISQRIKDSRN
jgi:hypothetical protein